MHDTMVDVRNGVTRGAVCCARGAAQRRICGTPLAQATQAHGDGRAISLLPQQLYCTRPARSTPLCESI